ncbi:MAG TPA: N-acetyltransferase [Ruminococcus sp.]|nr:N-acetyltransferase [Ruminococcus sp.]
MKTVYADTFALKAGACYVRIQAMARKHHITLEQEFDARDSDPQTRHLLLLDDDFPIACARFYPLGGDAVMLGRIVVLPEYRGKGLGSRIVRAAEARAAAEGFRLAVLEARIGKVGFYERLGYAAAAGAPVIRGETFDCIRMEKTLKQETTSRNLHENCGTALDFSVNP